MEPQIPSKAEIEEENLKIRRVRLLVDLTSSLLAQGNMSQGEMLNLVRATQETVLKIFPGRKDTFDLIYRPRFNRIIQERLRSN